MNFNTNRRISRILAAAALAGAIAAGMSGSAQASAPVATGTCGTLEVAVVYHPETTNLFVENFGAVPSTTITILDAETTNLFVENFGMVPTGGDLARCGDEQLTASEWQVEFGAVPDSAGR